MAKNITLMGASYSDVPAVDLPQTGGGTARFVDTSDADANQSSLLEGATAYVNGTKITGVIPQLTELNGDIAQSFYTENNQRKWKVEGILNANQGGVVYPGARFSTGEFAFDAVPANTVITPTSQTQSVGGANWMMEGAVTVSAMPTGTAGTPTATKGTVSNHSISVTPSVTNTTGYITGSTKTGTAVTVSASELTSGSETKTANGSYDVTNLKTLVVAVPIVTYYTGSSAPSSSLGSDGDIYLRTN